MLFAISGSQGSGKTTVINELKKRGFPVVERKTSRSILDEWNVALSLVNNDRDLTVKFQDEILRRKIGDECEAANDVSRIWFTERTYADLFTYALIAIGKDNEYSEWIDDYFVRCCEAQKTYSANFYLPAGRFDLEHDGVRGSNTHYAQMVNLVMKDVTSKMNKAAGYNPETIKPNGTVTVEIDQIELKYRTGQILGSISKFI